MKTAILNFLATRLGAWLTPVFAGLVAAGVAWLGQHAPWLKPLLTDENVALFITGCIAVVSSYVNYLTNSRNAKYIKPVQEIFNALGRHYAIPPIDADGVAGPITAQHAQLVRQTITTERMNGEAQVDETPSSAIASNPNRKG